MFVRVCSWLILVLRHKGVRRGLIARKSERSVCFQTTKRILCENSLARFLSVALLSVKTRYGCLMAETWSATICQRILRHVHVVV